MKNKKIRISLFIISILTLSNCTSVRVDGDTQYPPPIPASQPTNKEKEVIKVLSVDVSNSKLNLRVGGIQTLSSIVKYSNNTSDNDVTWSSNDESLVTIDSSGYLKALKVGTAIITSTSKKDNTKNSIIEVKIQPELQKDVKVTSISIKSAISEVKLGDNQSLIASVLYSDSSEDNTVSWKSSDSNIIEVDETGKLITKSEGNAIITATSKKDINQEAKITIKVVGIQVVSISTSENSLSLSLSETKKLIASVTYSNNTTDNKVSWKSLNEDIVSIDSEGNLKAIKEGSTTISVSSNKNNSIKNTINVTVIKDTSKTKPSTDLTVSSVVISPDRKSVV